MLARLWQRGGGACVLRPASRAATEVCGPCLINAFFIVQAPRRPRMLACARRHHHRTATTEGGTHGGRPVR